MLYWKNTFCDQWKPIAFLAPISLFAMLVCFESCAFFITVYFLTISIFRISFLDLITYFGSLSIFIFKSFSIFWVNKFSLSNLDFELLSLSKFELFYCKIVKLGLFYWEIHWWIYKITSYCYWSFLKSTIERSIIELVIHRCTINWADSKIRHHDSYKIGLSRCNTSSKVLSYPREYRVWPELVHASLNRLEPFVFVDGSRGQINYLSDRK